MFDEVMSFFESKTKGERMARRADFTPTELLKFLPYMGLLEPKVDDSGNIEDIYCRVCGSKCVILYGELTNSWLSSLEDSQIYSRIKKRCQITYDQHKEFAVSLQVLSKEEEHITIRALYVPLSGDNKIVDKVLVFIEGDSNFHAQDDAY